MGYGDFRDQLVAAPLKLVTSNANVPTPLYFRDQLVAAPLKLRFFGCLHVLILHFRDQLVAAPLKLAHSGSRWRCQPAFPRPIGRGPIEARWHRTIISRVATISATNWSRPH